MKTNEDSDDPIIYYLYPYDISLARMARKSQQIGQGATSEVHLVRDRLFKAVKTNLDKDAWSRTNCKTRDTRNQVFNMYPSPHAISSVFLW